MDILSKKPAAEMWLKIHFIQKLKDSYKDLNESKIQWAIFVFFLSD